MDPTAQLCSHRLHSVATFGPRNHCPVAPAVPLLVVIETVDRGQYIFIYSSNAKNEKKKKGKAGKAESGMSLLLGTLPGKSLVPQRSSRNR